MDEKYYSPLELAEMDKRIFIKKLTEVRVEKNKSTTGRVNPQVEKDILYFEGRLELIEKRIERLNLEVEEIY